MNLTSDLPRTYTVADVAEALHVHPQTVRALIRTGQLDSFKVGRYHRVTPEQLAAYLEAHRNEDDDQ